MKKLLRKSICIYLIIALLSSLLVSCSALSESKDKSILKNVKSLISENSYLEALDTLKDLNDPSKGDSLKEDIYDGMEKEITDLMKEGDYIKAQKKLDKYNMIPQYSSLAESLKYETFALYALMDLRPSLKNPSSLQVSEVLFFGATEDSEYPGMTLTTSGQNGFGGYATNYTMISAKDLTVVGSCSSLDVDKLSDYSEKLICVLIMALLEGGTKMNIKVDINRLNAVLSSGVTPKLDIEY